MNEGVADRMSALGQKRTNHHRPKSEFVRSCPITDKLLRCRDCPLSANRDLCIAASSIIIRSPHRLGHTLQGLQPNRSRQANLVPGTHKFIGVIVGTSTDLRRGHLPAVTSSIEPKSVDLTRDLGSSMAASRPRRPMSALVRKRTKCCGAANVRLVPKADIRTSRPFRISYSDQAENPDLLQSGLAHAFDEFCHRAGSIGDIAFDPRNRIFGMQFLQSH